MLHIRKANPTDLDRIMDCYEIARQFMRSSGNPNQWVNGYPSRELVRGDIEAGVSHVGVDSDGEIVMVFAFFTTPIRPIQRSATVNG